MAPTGDPVPDPPHDVSSSTQAPQGLRGRRLMLEDMKIYPDALRRFLHAEDERSLTSQTSSSAAEIPPEVLEPAIMWLGIPSAVHRDGLAMVYLGLLELPGRQPVPVAMRVYDESHSEAMEQRLAREMTIWPTLNHPRILPLLGHGTVASRTALITPGFCANLMDYLNTHPALDTRRLIIQIADGLDYLHNQIGIVHGDLKVISVFINSDGDAVLGGPVLSTSVLKSPLADPTLSGICMMNTVLYAAPEIIVGEGRDATGRRSKTTESDIYAFGMLIYEVLSGRRVWDGMTSMKVITNVINGQRPPRPEEGLINDAMWELCVACWDQDPAKRPRIADILAGLRSPELPRRWQVKEPDAVDPFAHSPQAEQAESPVCSEYHTPVLSPSDHSFYTCASWASTPRGATALTDIMDVVEEILQIEIEGAITDIALPKQKPLRGGFGKIMKGYAWAGGAVAVYAVKICEDRNVMPRELKIWKTLSHKNILPLRGAHESRGGKFPGSRKCILVSPYMKGGTLESYLKFNPLTPRLPLMIDVANGLHYLHNIKEIVHGDIKAENVLIADDGRAVLADFGLSTTVSPGPEISGLQIRQMFTLAYCAPEILEEDAEDPDAPGVTRSKTKMSDMYAYGVLVYQIYAGGFGKTMRQRILLIGAMHEGRLPKRPVGLLHVLCDDLWSICKRCWERNAGDRPPIATVLGELRELETSPERQAIETLEPEAPRDA